jgi:glyoxylase-like metal-dependent hydrolase (beta-lactamase superfamily II)
MREVLPDIFIVGGPGVTGGGDAYAYLIVSGAEAALIDAGCEAEPRALARNAEAALAETGARLKMLVLTHNHIDHVGGAAALKKKFGLRIAMHAEDAAALESGDDYATAADWYGVPARAAVVDVKLTGDELELRIGDEALRCIHTPGHTPGSIAVTLERDGRRVLFGQDIHGPFSPQFRSDLAAWRRSMEKLISLRCDILCEGHYGVIEPAPEVEKFIRNFLRSNK